MADENKYPKKEKSSEATIKGTSGRDSGTGSSSIIKRNIHGTRPFTGDLKRHG